MSCELWLTWMKEDRMSSTVETLHCDASFVLNSSLSLTA